MKMTTLQLTNSVNRSHIRLAFLLIPLACFALAATARATCQEGCDLSNGNTFLGDDALSSNTTGFDNAAVGSKTLTVNTTGSYNTAVGFNALFSNTIGYGNTATGWGTLFSNTTGVGNTATGASALFFNTTGGNNTATGSNALYFNTTGSGNTAIGWGALTFNFQGYNNTATGEGALGSNRNGIFNTATGQNALFNNKNGAYNIALGDSAGFNITGSQNIDIGNAGAPRESNTIRIGTNGTQTNTYVAGISGVTVTDGVGVIVGPDGHLGTVVSSQRYKEAIKPMDKTSEAILSLKPVTFRYKHDLDPAGIPQFGLVAEEVDKVNPALVARDEQGKPYTVRYDAVNAMLLNEFLKEHRKVEELQANAVRQQKQIDALTAGLQKVSAQLEASRPAPRTVQNSH
jgi:endosialidase-like protein